MRYPLRRVDVSLQVFKYWEGGGEGGAFLKPYWDVPNSIDTYDFQLRKSSRTDTQTDTYTDPLCKMCIRFLLPQPMNEKRSIVVY